MHNYCMGFFGYRVYKGIPGVLKYYRVCKGIQDVLEHYRVYKVYNI